MYEEERSEVDEEEEERISSGVEMEESKCEEDNNITPWTCAKCSHVNTDREYKCYFCFGWKDGKMPKKKSSIKKSTVETVELPHTLSKKDYKPLFEKGDPVYAPWWPSNGSRADQTWYPGVIEDYVTLKNGKYGPVRKYNILFDDGDQLDRVEDYCIFSREDYLLSEKKREWVGVANKLDPNSSDEWAKIVGWYEATIGECRQLV